MEMPKRTNKNDHTVDKGFRTVTKQENKRQGNCSSAFSHLREDLCLHDLLRHYIKSFPLL